MQLTATERLQVIHTHLPQETTINLPLDQSITQGMISENADDYTFIDHDDVPNVRLLSSSNESLQNPSESRFQRILDSSATFLKDEDIAAVSMQQKHHHQQLVASVEINNGEQHQQQQLENHQHHQQQQDQQKLGSSVILNANNKGTQNYICVDSSEEQICTKGLILINEDSSMKPPQKRRGRKKKNLLPGNILSDMPTAINGGENICCFERKERKKHDRFNGMSEEEVAKRLLPDHLCNNLDIVIVGINPGLFAAFKGHHYAGPGNHFWKCLYLAGLTHDQMSAEEDFTLTKYGIGFTNMVQRATKGSADLTRKEIKEGSRILLEKLQRFRPKIAVFNGKLIYEVFSGKKDFHFGRQPEFVDGTDTYIWVMPSSSARCAQLPRAADKVPFYLALKKFRDYLNGLIPHMDETECVFTELKIKQFCEQSNLKFLITGDGVNLSSVNKSDSISNNSDDKVAKTESDLIQLNNNICDHNKSNDNIYLTKSLERNAIQQHYKSVHRFYLYGSQENVSSTGMSSHPHGSGQHNLMGMNENGFMISNCQTVSLLPKKKRGRPKKIKETTDPSTASKILVRGSGHNFSNILNLSIIRDSHTEVAKKKRGRPKKLKSTAVTQTPQQHRQQQLLLEKCNTMPIQAIAEEHSLPLQQERMPCSQAPQNIQQQQGSYANSPSPIRTPERKGIFLSETPPETQPNAPRKKELKIEFLDQSIRMRTADKSNYYAGKISQPAISSSMSSPPQTRLQNKHMTTEASELIANELFLKKSTAPISQNVCAVDFDPPCLSRSSEPRKIEADFSQRQSSSHEKQHQQRSRYASPISDTVDEQLETNKNLHQWMSPNIHQQQQHLPIGLHSSLNFSHQRQPTMVMHYQDQQMNHREEPQLNWQHHRQFQVNFDESTHNYILDIQHQQQQIDQLSQQQSQQLTSDVSRNSLSGLESLVDKIPTMSESETHINNSLSVSATSAVENSLHISVSAALENSLQTMETAPSDNQHNRDSLVSEGNAEMYIELGTSCTLNITNNDNNDNIICENSGSNAPPITNSNYPSGSPGNYSVHRHHSLSAASSPVSHASMQSPHYQLHTTAQLTSQYNDHRIYASSPSECRMNHMTPSIPNGILNSPPNVDNISIPLLGSSFSGSVLNKNCNNTANNIHTNNFSVSHLAASSVTPSASASNVNDSYPSPTTSNATYHHSNILTAAGLTSSAVNTLPICDEPTPVAITTLSNHISSHPHLHLDPHAHLSVPVKTNVHGNSHVHPHLLTHVFGPSAQGQHSPVSDFDATPYGSPSTAVAAIQAGNQDLPAHTLHMPSPNYPYGYATPPTQSSYANAMHVHSQSTPLPSGAVSAVAAAAAAAAVAEYHNAHHQQHHGHPSAHHISVFERLKASDIGGYSSF